MGDEELNFTDEEARCWADDPHNQAQEDRTFVRAVLVSLILVISIVIVAFLASLRESKSGVEPSRVGYVVGSAGQVSTLGVAAAQLLPKAAAGRGKGHANETG